MLETAVALIFAHLLADFILQTRRMVTEKRRPLIFALHLAVVAGTAWAALGLSLAAGPAIAIVTATHGLIDAAKLHWGRGGLTAFLADQAAHLAVLGGVAVALPDLFAAGLWPSVPGPVVAGMVLGAGLIAAVWAGGYAVAALMTAIPVPPDPASLPSGGRLIGRLERLLILMLVLAGQATAIGFLIAAKSILRFNEIAGSADRHVSEYVIIGTLASFAWAIAVAFVTEEALHALGP